MTRKLTRQERKEALAKYDDAIAKWEMMHDLQSPWVGDLPLKFVNEFQSERADALARLEGRTITKDSP